MRSGAAPWVGVRDDLVQGVGPDALLGRGEGLDGAWGWVRDEALEGAWLALHGLGEQPLEQQAAVSGIASVEAKHELVEIARQVVGIDRSLSLDPPP